MNLEEPNMTHGTEETVPASHYSAVIKDMMETKDQYQIMLKTLMDAQALSTHLLEENRKLYAELEKQRQYVQAAQDTAFKSLNAQHELLNKIEEMRAQRETH